MQISVIYEFLGHVHTVHYCILSRTQYNLFNLQLVLHKTKVRITWHQLKSNVLIKSYKKCIYLWNQHIVKKKKEKRGKKTSKDHTWLPWQKTDLLFKMPVDVLRSPRVVGSGPVSWPARFSQTALLVGYSIFATANVTLKKQTSIHMFSHPQTKLLFIKQHFQLLLVPLVLLLFHRFLSAKLGFAGTRSIEHTD